MATPASARVSVNPFTVIANTLAAAADTDVFLFNSEIKRPYDQMIIDECTARRRRTNVTLLLVTEGGDADAAYRIARILQESYEKLTCIVPGYCKSAGTLVAIGANELVMSDGAELGPLDVQMSKKDELGQWQSGLTITSSLQALHEKSFSAFEHFFLTIKRRSHNNVTLKTATEIAAKLTSGLFAPIFQQIDPIHVGEAYRATAIAFHYGARLDFISKNLEEGSLDQLISKYPTHGFVIDRSEAESLFKIVRKPNADETALIECLGEEAREPLDSRRFLNDEREDNVGTPKTDSKPVQGLPNEPLATDAGADVPQSLEGRSSTESAEE
jgi:hypothetical protein